MPRRAGRGRAFAGATRRGRYAGRSGGRFRCGKPGRSFRVAGRKRGAGGAWPRGAHKGRVSGATAQGGHVSGRRGAGGIRRLSGVDAGKVRDGRRYTAGGPGIAGAAGLLPGCGERRPRTGEKRSDLRGLCRVTGHRWEWRQRRGRKGPFSLYKEALFAGARALSIQS